MQHIKIWWWNVPGGILLLIVLCDIHCHLLKEFSFYTYYLLYPHSYRKDVLTAFSIWLRTARTQSITHWPLSLLGKLFQCFYKKGDWTIVFFKITQWKWVPNCKLRKSKLTRSTRTHMIWLEVSSTPCHLLLVCIICIFIYIYLCLVYILRLFFYYLLSCLSAWKTSLCDDKVAFYRNLTLFIVRITYRSEFEFHLVKIL